MRRYPKPGAFSLALCLLLLSGNSFASPKPELEKIMQGYMEDQHSAESEFDSKIPSELKDLAATINYPDRVCAITEAENALTLCLPGETLWYTPQLGPDHHPQTMYVIAALCDHDKPVQYDRTSVVCRFKPSQMSVIAEPDERVPFMDVEAFNQDYTERFFKVLQDRKGVKELRKHVYAQVIEQGGVIQPAMKKGDRLTLTFAGVGPDMRYDGSFKKTLEYTYQEALQAPEAAVLVEYWNYPGLSLILYSMENYMPRTRTIASNRDIPKAMIVTIGGITTKEELAKIAKLEGKEKTAPEIKQD